MPAESANWPTIRAAYVEGVSEGGHVTWPTLNELAVQWGASPDNVRRRAATENWTEARAAFQRQVEEERRAVRAAEMARLGADLDIRVLRAAATGLGIAEGRLAEFGRMTQARTAALRELEHTPGTKLPLAPSSDEVSIVATSITKWYELGNRALGQVPTARLVVDGGRPVQVEHSLTQGEQDKRTAGILAVLEEAGVVPHGIFSNGHGTASGNGSGGDYIDVGGAAHLAGEPGNAEDEPLHPEDVDPGEPE